MCFSVRQKNARILPVMGKKGGKSGKNAKMVMMPNGLSQEITQPYSQSMSQVISRIKYFCMRSISVILILTLQHLMLFIVEYVSTGIQFISARFIPAGIVAR